MRQVSFHGEHLQLTREISARLGENTFTLRDVVENLGTRPEAHMILYHFNVGFPLLDDGAVLEVDAARTDGINERGDAIAAVARQVQGPQYGYQEQVVVHDVSPGADGWASARVNNAGFNGGRGLIDDPLPQGAAAVSLAVAELQGARLRDGRRAATRTCVGGRTTASVERCQSWRSGSAASTIWKSPPRSGEPRAALGLQ